MRAYFVMGMAFDSAPPRRGGGLHADTSDVLRDPVHLELQWVVLSSRRHAGVVRARGQAARCGGRLSAPGANRKCTSNHVAPGRGSSEAPVKKVAGPWQRSGDAPPCH